MYFLNNRRLIKIYIQQLFQPFCPPKPYNLKSHFNYQLNTNIENIVKRIIDKYNNPPNAQFYSFSRRKIRFIKTKIIPILKIQNFVNGQQTKPPKTHESIWIIFNYSTTFDRFHFHRSNSIYPNSNSSHYILMNPHPRTVYPHLVHTRNVSRGSRATLPLVVVCSSIELPADHLLRPNHEGKGGKGKNESTSSRVNFKSWIERTVSNER